MRSLGEVLAGTGAPKRQAGNKYRRNSVFVLDELAIGRPLDRNDKARILFCAEALERRSKAPGRKNGHLGYVGLAVLRCLLLRFLGANGVCSPSYLALQCASGLCRQSIADGLRRLSEAGILRIVRRLQRQVVNGVVMTRQGSNLYSFVVPEKREQFESLPRIAHDRTRTPEGRVYDAGRNLPSDKLKGLLRSLAQGLAMGSGNYPQLCE
jgi:hypothetical protein